MIAVKGLLLPFYLKASKEGSWQSLLGDIVSRHSGLRLYIYICNFLIPKSISGVGGSPKPASFFLYLKRLKSKGRGRGVKNGIATKTLNK